MAAFEKTRTIGSAELDLKKMSKQDHNNLMAITLDAMDRFFKASASKEAGKNES